MTAQENSKVVAPVNSRVGTTAIRVKDFTTMNPREFHGSKVEEDPQEFIDEVHKIVEIMGITSVEKVWGDNRSQGNGSSEKMVSECRRCGKIHRNECLVGSNTCYGCGKSGHKMKDWLLLATRGRDGRRVKPSDTNSYALHTRQDHEGTSDVTIDKLWFFSLWLCIACYWVFRWLWLLCYAWVEGDEFKKTREVCSPGTDNVLGGLLSMV
ncbi:hypothetical protein MTR67_017701 [Solanum verrucosum]|uniref:Gag-pol polyprotein n=1 Tax=Solanum verrucosum TaxID=315347 RepID=A0AAF0QJB0_SOLVR|nr:hypothetical protein MTR67_017701 [Solanum verrucosum]